MNKKITQILSGLFMAAVLFSSCKKVEGPQGPAGNANVSSGVFTISSWLWQTPNYYTELSVPELTSANIDKAGVMAYFNYEGPWIAMPYTVYNGSSSNYVMGFTTYPGIVRVNWYYNTSLFDGIDPNDYYNTNVKIKVVVIPPAALALHPEVDLRNYEQVKTVFKIKD